MVIHGPTAPTAVDLVVDDWDGNPHPSQPAAAAAYEADYVHPLQGPELEYERDNDYDAADERW